MSKQEENKEWYALRVTYRRELLVKNRLDEVDIENYIPMHWAEKIVAGRKHKVYTPLIHNLIFVHLTPCAMKQIKTDTRLPICYIMDHATNCPAVISEHQMNRFMVLVAMQDAAQVKIVEPHLLDLKNGEMVRVIDGPFKGVVGACVKSNGRSRVAVEITQIAAALTTYIPMKYLEKIDLK